MALDKIPGTTVFSQRDVRETSNIGLSPNITDYTDAQHDHSNAAGGGQISEASISHTNITNIGTNTHSVIDTHLAAANPHTGHVDTTGNETIAGIKTFSSFIVGPIAAPTTDYQMANKKYVDDATTPITAPVGSVVAWLKTFTNTPALPTGWVECDGSVLSDAGSVYNGQTIPDLNGNNYFLRGNSTSGGTGGSSTHTLTTAEMPSHTHTVGVKSSVTGGTVVAQGTNQTDTTYNSGSTGSGNAHENKPPYYDMVWIMRIK